MTDLVFSPVVLKWAREQRFGTKFEVLRERWADSWEDISPELIGEWERGVGHPTFAQVRKLSAIYKRPVAVFFLDGSPDEKQNPPDLRTVGSQDNKVLSPEALLAIRKARRVQAVAADLFKELGHKPEFKYRPYSIEDSPAKLASFLRADLSVSTASQFHARKFENFFEYLRAKIEGTGVVTLKSGLHDSFPTADCRAFSFADRLPFLILVNNKDSEGAKNFSLMHEFAHLLLRTEGICNNFSAFGPGKRVNPVEVFCNQFAASFLVPSDDLKQHLAIRGKSVILPEELDRVTERLALAFKVSRVVILRRLLTLDVISSETYAAKADAWKDEDHPRSKGGGRFSLKTTLAKNGLAFSSLVLNAYREKKLSYAGASDYLGIKTKHLPRLEKLIDSHAG